MWLTNFKELNHSTDSGKSYVAIEDVTEANQIGFGNAAEGKKYPALYLMGKVGDTRGFFRSDDAGVTWVRINDDRHQFGFCGVIIGDPRVRPGLRGHRRSGDFVWRAEVARRESASDFTTESTEITETDRKERRVRTRIRNPFLPASVASVPSVVKLRIAHLAGVSQQSRTVRSRQKSPR